jgi:dipeptidase E
MKKLLLTSNGWNSGKIRRELLKVLDKPLAECKVLVMHTGKFKRKYLKPLLIPGLSKKNILFVDIAKNVNADKFKERDIFFSCGGNTFYILERVKKTGFDKYIKKFVKQGKLYVGISAGSIIVHKTIEISGWGIEGDRNELGLRDLKGLNIFDIAILPHYKDKQKKELKEFRKRANYKIQELRDGEALLVLGKSKKLIK